MDKARLEISEMLLLISGALFLASAVWIATGGSFNVLLSAKLFYAVGLILLIFNK